MLSPVDPVAAGIRRCPFLHRLASTEGDDFARNVAVNPLAPATHDDDKIHQRPVFEELENFSRTFRLFHGPDGVVPLANEKVERGTNLAAFSVAKNDRAEQNVDKACQRLAVGLGASAASMSLSNFGFLVRKADLSSMPRWAVQPSTLVGAPDEIVVPCSSCETRTCESHILQRILAELIPMDPCSDVLLRIDLFPSHVACLPIRVVC